MKQQEEKTPEEVEKIAHEVITNQTESEKFKKNSKDKPSEKSEEEKTVEEIIANL